MATPAGRAAIGPRLPCLLLAALALAAIGSACSGGDDPDPADLPDASSDRDAGGDAAASLDGEADAADAADAGPLFCLPVPEGTPGAPPVCAAAASWSNPTQVVAGVALGAITPDALTLVSIRFGAAPEFYVADRATTSEAFGDPERVVLPFVESEATVGVFPDGLGLVLLGEDKRSFVEMHRASKGAPFELVTPNVTFAAINAAAAQLPESVSYDDPVVGADGLSFVYSLSAGSSADARTVRLATRTGQGAFGAGVALDDCELLAVGDARRRPTALSSDRRALFYYDEARGEARSAHRADAQGLFSTFLSLGARTRFQPTNACGQLYWTRDMAGDPEIVVESR